MSDSGLVVSGLPVLLMQQLAGLYHSRHLALCHCPQDDWADSLREVPLAMNTLQVSYFDSELGITSDAFDMETTVLLVCPFLDVTVFLNPSNRRLLSSRFVWLLNESLIDKGSLDSLPLRLDSNLISYGTTGYGGLALRENYKIKGGDIVTSPLGVWTHRGGGGLHPQSRLKWERRSNLRGVLLTDVTMQFAPWTIKVGEDEDGGGGLKLEGMLIDMLEVMKESLNFTTVARFPEDLEWGYLKVTNNSAPFWTGIVGDLAYERADIR